MSVEIMHGNDDGSVDVEIYDGRYGLMSVETYPSELDYHLDDRGDSKTAIEVAPVKADAERTAQTGGGVDIL